MARVESEVLRRRNLRRVSWGAIFGGTVVALGFWAMLYALGLALGLSTINPNQSIRGPAVFTGIWSIVTPLVALFVGGYVAARLAGFGDRTAGALHGAVLWGLTLLVGAFAVVNLLGTVIGGAAKVGGSAVSGAAGMVQGQGGPGQVQKALGIQTNDLLQPINQRLQAQGKPQITSQQLSAAVQDAVQTSVRQGRLDSQTFSNALARNTNLSQADVREISGTLEQRVNQALAGVEQSAAAAAADVGKAFWGIFFGLLLGLISAVLGAIVGISGFRRYERRRIAPPVQRPVEVR